MELTKKDYQVMDKLLAFEISHKGRHDLWGEFIDAMGFEWQKEEHQSVIDKVIYYNKHVCKMCNVVSEGKPHQFFECNALTDEFVAEGGFKKYYVTYLRPNKVDWDDVMKFLHTELQPQSIEEIMVALCGEKERDNISLAKKINQIIEMLIQEKNVLQKDRLERRIDGLPYIAPAKIYYLSYAGEEYMKEMPTNEEIGEDYIGDLEKIVKEKIKKIPTAIWNLVKALAIILTIVAALIEIVKYRQEQSLTKSNSREYHQSP